MSKMKLEEDEGVSLYHVRLEEWTSKEMQLNRLHGEIINKRDALVRTSRNFLHKAAQQEPLPDDTDATIINEKLMKDITALEEYLAEKQSEPVSPRFSYLLANHKSMVENLFPLWQRSLEESQARAGKGGEEKHGHK